MHDNRILYKYKVKVEIGEKLVRPGQNIKILVFRGLQDQTVKFNKNV